MDGAHGWKPLADRFYWRQRLFPASWPGVDFESLAPHLVAGAPFGGAVALLRDGERALPTHPGTTAGSRARVEVRTSGGNVIASLAWERARVVGLGWLEGERLAVVSDDGTVCVFSVRLALLREFRVAEKLLAEGVAACVVLPSGVLLVSGRHKLSFLPCVGAELPARSGARAAGQRAAGGPPAHERPLLRETSAVALADPRLEGPPRALAALDPSLSPSGGVRVFVATRSGTVLSVCAATSSDAMLTQGPFCALALAPSGRLLAACADSGQLLVWPAADLSRPPLTCCAVAPPAGCRALSRGGLRQLLWCGSDAVLLSWAGGSAGESRGRGGLTLVGPSGDCAHLDAEPAEPPQPVAGAQAGAAAEAEARGGGGGGGGGSVLCVGEADCARLLTARGCYVLSRVGESAVAALRPPAAAATGGSGGGGAGARQPQPGAPPAAPRRAVPATAAQALLLASESLLAGDGLRADELVRALGGGVGGAAAAAREAALECASADMQLALLRAAAIGHAAHCAHALAHKANGAVGAGAHLDGAGRAGEGEEGAGMAAAVSSLRLLAAARAPPLCVALTAAQLGALGTARFVGRLLERGEHFLAARASELCGLPRAPVLEHWACARIAAAAADGGGGAAAAADGTQSQTQSQTQSPAPAAGAAAGAGGSAAGDEALLASLLPRLQSDGAVSYARVASAAHAHGRAALAAQLLQLEPRPSEQVPLLLQMRLFVPALARAVASHEPDLVHLSLLSAQQALPADGFASLLRGNRTAAALHAAYCAQQDRAALAAIYARTGRPLEAARVAQRNAYLCARLADRLAALSSAAEQLAAAERASPAASSASPLAGGGAAAGAAAREAAQALSLLRSQLDLELATDGVSPPDGALERSHYRAQQQQQHARPPARPAGVCAGPLSFRDEPIFCRGAMATEPAPAFRFIDTSLSHTLHNCFLYAQGRRASKLRSEFKVSDKRFWHIQIRALAHCRDWEALAELAAEKKSPVGYGPFIDACLEMGEAAEGKKYVSRLSTPRLRATYLIRLGCPAEAREVAVVAKDADLLESIARNELR